LNGDDEDVDDGIVTSDELLTCLRGLSTVELMSCSINTTSTQQLYAAKEGIKVCVVVKAFRPG
jgi:hypothetical protein